MVLSYSENVSTRDYKCEMNGLNTLVLLGSHAIVFLRARYAGAAVLKMTFWKSDISFNIDLGLTNLIVNNRYFLVELQQIESAV